MKILSHVRTSKSVLYIRLHFFFNILARSLLGEIFGYFLRKLKEEFYGRDRPAYFFLFKRFCNSKKRRCQQNEGLFFNINTF